LHWKIFAVYLELCVFLNIGPVWMRGCFSGQEDCFQALWAAFWTCCFKIGAKLEACKIQWQPF